MVLLKTVGLLSLFLALPSKTFGFTTPVSLRRMTPTSPKSSTKTRLDAEASSTAAIESPFGTWESPITSKSITAGSVGIGSLKLRKDNNDNDQLFWMESRPQEGGRSVICRYDPNSEDKSERDAVDVSPKDCNVRTRVHEYGGAAVTMGDPAKGEIFFSEFSTQQLVQLHQDGGSITYLSEEDDPYRFADGVLVSSSSEDDASSSSKKTIYSVREDHTNPKEPQNTVVSITIEGDSIDTDTSKTQMTVKASGNDFYASPRVSPDGKKLAYVTWDHPSMPWDSTSLRICSLDGSEEEEEVASSDSSTHEIIAGSEGEFSILQPLWHPKTGDLYYISDKSGYYNIYRTGYSDSILPMDYDFGGSAPGWILGQQGFSFLPDGRLTAVYQKDGKSVLVVANVMGDGPATDVKEYGMDDGLPMQFGGVVGNDSDDFYFVGGSPAESTSVYKWNLNKKGAAEVLARSSTLSFSDDLISIPQQIKFPTTLGESYGYYYPPKNGKYECTDAAPPLLVKAHGGPTACTGTSFNPGIQFWTSRGFAVLDVDYGGSSGYGREYRNRLRKAWGIVDVDDVCNGAKYLVEQGLADGDRLCIDGGSAGGFTTLAALAFRDVFKAGCSLYGIGDLTALAGDTHKFESRYLDGLVGSYPEEEQLYKDRSPIESVETLSCPILLLQGEEDKVVPPNQAVMMHEALLKKGIPCCLKIYADEQHGFRLAENIEDALDSELAFYGKVFGIDIPNAIELDIDNM